MGLIAHQPRPPAGAHYAHAPQAGRWDTSRSANRGTPLKTKEPAHQQYNCPSGRVLCRSQRETSMNVNDGSAASRQFVAAAPSISSKMRLF